jgi:lipoprotein-anchoring transpeptidase ErfK/SrfK
MWTGWRILVVVWSVVASAAALAAGTARADDPVCANALRGASVGAPERAVAWRAEIEARTAVFDRPPTKRLRPSRRIEPGDAAWLLVLSRPHAAGDRCWLKVRLPWRPNHASGWVDAGALSVEQTPWRIAISTARRQLVVYRAGARVRTLRVVVGKPSTPTPAGRFAVTWAIRWHPSDFLGSWVLELTAHSTVLQRFDGGDGTVGIHGRGGASLLDPLGSARSHGCIRLSNHAIEWLVHTIGASHLPGTPVDVR